MADFLLAWDIETVPQFPDQSLADPDGSFPKLPFHSIICIGALAAFRTDSGWEIEALAAQTAENQSEKQLIRSFVDFVGEHQPRMVTFNGHSFDLTVLRYRAMIHGISAPGLHSRSYYHRFTEDHVDLCDVLSSFSYSGKAKLDEISRVMGLPGKPDGIDGSQVQAYYEAGRIDEIAEYCVSDVLNTYRIWLRYELFRGGLTREEFEFSDAAAQSHERQPTTVASMATLSHS
jgi:predicted PolB exonuclease-like 3'-5' exonuclease